MAAQLGWSDAEQPSQDSLGFRGKSGQAIAVSFREKKGEPIGRCAIRTGSMEFKVAHSPQADLLDVAAADRSCRMPAGCNSVVRLMSEELMRGGPHKVYLRAMNCVRDFL